MPEIKPRSMRMSDENYTKLQALSENRSLDDTISFLLKILDKDEERNGLGNQETKLDEFDSLITALRSMYASSLHICMNTKEIVKNELQKEFAQKEETINQLQKELVESQRKLLSTQEETKNQLNTILSQNQKYKEKLDDLTNQRIQAKETLTQKQQALDSLTTALSISEKKVSHLEQNQQLLLQTKQQLEEIKKENIQLKKEKTLQSNQLEDTQKAFQQLQNEINDAKSQAKQHLNDELDKLNKLHQQEIKTLKTQTELSIREAKIDAASQINEIREIYQEKLFALLKNKEQTPQ